MVGELMYAFRVMRLPLLDAGGGAIGKIDDIVVVPGRALEAPRVLGFVVSSQRRRIFVSTSRIATVDNEGVRLKSWDVDLNPFHPRPGERLIGKDVLDKRIPTTRSPIEVGLPLYFDPTLSWWATVLAASEGSTPLAVRFVFPNSSKLVANAYWSLLEVPTIEDSTLRTRIDLSFSATPKTYTS